MKTTIYFYAGDGVNGLIMQQGDKYIDLGGCEPTGIFDDIPNHSIDLYPDDVQTAVSQLKAAYDSVADKHIMYDFEDMLNDYGDKFDIFTWPPNDGWNGKYYPIATIDGSCGTIEVLEDAPAQEQFELEPSPEVMTNEVMTQPMMGL